MQSIIAWVMRISNGRITSEKDAKYVLFGITFVALAAAYYLLRGDAVSPTPDEYQSVQSHVERAEELQQNPRP